MRPPPKALLIHRQALRPAVPRLTLGLLGSLGCILLCEPFLRALYNVALNKCRDGGGVRHHGDLNDVQVVGLSPQCKGGPSLPDERVTRGLCLLPGGGNGDH